MASDPSTCSTTICAATKWKAALACTQDFGCSVGAYVEDERCTSSFVVCDDAFRTEVCGSSATSTPAPALTIPPSSIGVDPAVGEVQQPPRPAVLRFGMAADTLNRVTGCHEIGGVQMAFNQINKNGGAAGTKLELVVDHVQMYDPDLIVAALHRQLVDHNVFAFPQTSFYAPSAVYRNLARPNGIPMINPYFGETYVESDRSVISIHPQPTQFMYHFFKFAIHGSPMCTRFGIALWNMPELVSFVDLLDQIVPPFGYGKVLRVMLPPFVPPNFDHQVSLFDDFFKDEENIPNCIGILNHYEILPALRRHPKFDPTTHIFQTDYTVHHYRFVDPFEKHSNWYVDHHTLLSVFPDPMHETSRLARSYREALAEHVFHANQTECEHIPSAQQFEAYTAGRFIGEVVAKMDPTNNFTRENFIDTVYKTAMFPIEDMKFGVFIDGCDGLSTEASGSCFCTFGGRQVFTRVVQPNGYLSAYTDNHSRGEFGIAEFTIPTHHCTVRSVALSVPLSLRFVSFIRDVGASSSTSTLLVPFYRQLLVGYNRQSQKQERMARMYYIPTDEYQETPNAVQNVSSRFGPAAFVDGDVHLLPSDTLHLQVQPDAHGALPVAVEPDSFNSHRVWLVSFLEDHVHALAVFAATSLKLEERMHVVGTSEAAASIGVRSVETFGHSPRSTTSSATSLSTTANEVKAGDAFLVVAETATAVANAVQLALQRPDIVVLVACSEEHLEAAMQGTERQAELQKATQLYFATPFGAFWNNETSAFASTVASLDSTASEFVDLVPPVPAFSVSKMRAGLAINILGASAAARQTKMDEVYNWLYFGLRTIDGVAFGPLSREPCSSSSDRLCECTKSLKDMHVFPVAVWASGSAAGDADLDTNATSFHYIAPFCAPDYKPLPTFTLSAEIIVTIVAAVLTVVFGVIALIAATRKLRNTAAAPKDETKPFAMVFTDIQSSTTLWAECPVEMGEGVEMHHTILRSLIDKHKGYEVKTIGDSFMVAFTSPLKATAFALDIQTTLFNHDWGTEAFDEIYHEKICDAAEATEGVSPEDLEGQIDPALWSGIRVRVGVHYGTGSIQKDEVTHGYDYYGTVVNTAARVESVGNGGQVLLTEAAHKAVFVDEEGNYLKHLGSVDVKDMGPQPLRGLPHDVRLFQCTPAALANRRYAPLRIESEAPKDDDNEDDQVEKKTQSSDSCPTTSLSEDEGFLRDAMIARVVRRHWNTHDSQMLAKQRLLEGLAFVNGILVTAGSNYRKMFIKHVAAKWHIDIKNEHENTALVHVLARVLRGIETKERRLAAGGGDGLTGSGRRRDSMAGSGRRPSGLGSGSCVSVGSTTKVVSVGPMDHPL